MAVKSTKEVFDSYFKNVSPSVAQKCRMQVDRDEVYEYEEKLGKQIFDMDVDELFGLIKSFGKKKGREYFNFSYNSFAQISTLYRSIWNFYIDNFNVIKNPWNDKRMSGIAAAKRIAESKKKFTNEDFEHIIRQLYFGSSNYKDYTPKYMECLLLLFHDGFAHAEEIVLLKEKMIDFRSRKVRLERCDVDLSDRCYEMLQYVHNLDREEIDLGAYEAIPYRDGYFKFIIKRANVDSFQERSTSQVSAYLTRKMSRCLREQQNIDINYRTVYLLGFYEYIVSKIGKEETGELVMSLRDNDKNQKLMEFVKEYGLKSNNVTTVKRMLMPYI